MAFDTKVRKLWAILAIPAILLGIGASYERGGLAGLRDMTLDMLKSAGIYRPAPDETPLALYQRFTRQHYLCGIPKKVSQQPARSRSACEIGGTTEHPTDDHANADAGTRSHDNADAASVT